VEPEFIDSTDAQLEAVDLSHPRLSRDRRVGNDLQMHRKSEAGACHLITGSNMAGKSTFLRTVGLNVILARSGAKVPAQRLRLSPLRVETSLRPGDSLDDGFSSFYAEVRELRAMLSRAQERELTLYLIDEIFRGTNNRERRQGAEAYIRAIAATTAIGAVTTHDLDLATLESQVPGLKNFHFKDEVVEGRMQFSFKKEIGPCPSTNALRVMQLEGLPV
jgi:DNA mismatch repair ATPase MutS